MTKSLSHLALIPARGGSIGIKDKNLQKIAGKSLVKWAYDFCSESKIFNTIMLSTDSSEISETISASANFSVLDEDEILYLSENNVIHKRALSDSGTFSLISDLVIKLANLPELDFEYLWLIQPTSLFREKIDIQQILEILNGELDWTSIVSVKDFTKNHPDRMFRFNGDYVEPFLKENEIETIPRQLLSKVYIKDGAFYIFKKVNLQKGIFLGNKILPYCRSSSKNINIDDFDDLNYARFIEAIKNE
jgi:CMP-N-acetylneuraminic acid synthetase